MNDPMKNPALSKLMEEFHKKADYKDDEPLFDEAIRQAYSLALDAVLAGMPEESGFIGDEWHTQCRKHGVAEACPKCDGFDDCRSRVIELVEGLRNEIANQKGP